MTEGQGLQELATQLEQGIDPYTIIGKLYVQTLAKDQALAIAVQALRTLMPQEAPKDPGPPADPTAPAEPSNPEPLAPPMGGQA